ncbi:MAG: adenylyltransferase/cytidyltransferase family protein [Chloroflexi bacterium]|nr:adenylyltransferase/cytidyltransferase family protein [Chloroflexota bacterium]
MTLDEARARRSDLRANQQPLVLTNGHFDLLHVGHLDYLEKARALGAALYVGVNDDAGTRRLKGVGRPLIPAHERARLLAALAPVTAVILFSEDTAEALITALQPEIYVKGGDYALADAVSPTRKALPEAAVVQHYGGQIVFIDYLPNHSTSDLIARVKALR